jgi:hypothetical protein
VINTFRFDAMIEVQHMAAVDEYFEAMLIYHNSYVESTTGREREMRKR